MGKIPITPELMEFAEQSGGYVANFSVGFVWLKEELVASQRESKGGLAGSGTLVRVDDTRAILTAAHVIEAFSRTGPIGLVLPTSMHETHRIVLDMAYVRTECLPRGKDASSGPDIGVVILPPNDANTLGARQSFYNLINHRDQVMSSPMDTSGPWLLAGWPGEWVRERPVGEKGYRKVYEFHGFGGIGSAFNPVERGEFDCIDFGVDHAMSDYKGPGRYEGFSGGGLWRSVGFDLKKCSVERWELFGVAYYQSDIEDGKQMIKCHGRRSIYEHVVNLLRNL